MDLGLHGSGDWPEPSDACCGPRGPACGSWRALADNGNTLLILTSGHNRNNNPTGSRIPDEANEYIFVYDMAGDAPLKRQVLQVRHTFNGMDWHPSGNAFHVSGGVDDDDNVHVFAQQDGSWKANGSPISLGHTTGNGLDTPHGGRSGRDRQR
jgi:hypothetical protein